MYIYNIQSIYNGSNFTLRPLDHICINLRIFIS